MDKQRRITVRGIIFKDGKILGQQLKGSNGEARDYWCTPGGGLDPGESLHAGLTREMIEETGIAPQIGELLFVQQYQDEAREFLEFFFHIRNAEDYRSIDLAATSHGELEVDVVDFIAPHEHNILPAFLQRIGIQEYIDTPQPVIVATEL